MSASRWFLAPRVVLELDDDAWDHIERVFPVFGEWVQVIHERIDWGSWGIVSGSPAHSIVRFIPDIWKPGDGRF